MNTTNNTTNDNDGKGMIKHVLQNKYLKGSLLLTAGLLLGWLLFHQPAGKQGVQLQEAHDEHEHTTWTCSMHPQIRMDEPGLCPICGMDLIPLQNDGNVTDDSAIAMSESAMKLAEVQTTLVTKGGLSKELQLYGKVVPNERLLQSQTAHVPGRIDELYINTIGEQISKGQLLAKIYSPELITAQKELLEATALKDKYPTLVEAAREKLRNWKLNDQQISQLEKSGQAQSEFPIYANTSGIVIALNVAVGDYVSRGATLFGVAGLSSVWVEFDAYESDLPWVSKNQLVSFTTQALPDENFSGKVSFIDPVVNATTRVARVRVEVPNPALKLKPELFVNGIIQASTQNPGNELIIPQSAVLWTGVRSVVYVKTLGTDQPSFKMRDVELGSAMNNAWVVKDGLQEGEEIVTNGTFAVDAAAQLAGKPSMMNQPAKNSHANMDMGTSNSTKPVAETPGKTATADHTMFKVAGNCEMCKDRIETAAKGVNSVLSASWDADKQMVHLQLDTKKTSADAVQKAIAAAGHDTEKYKAPDAVYNELPGCCQYR
ncbi:MAG: efflux RND transporter periplasmic adaptor subunit [Mangrovibacterium sp.]